MAGPANKRFLKGDAASASMSSNFSSRSSNAIPICRARRYCCGRPSAPQAHASSSCANIHSALTRSSRSSPSASRPGAKRKCKPSTSPTPSSSLQGRPPNAPTTSPTQDMRKAKNRTLCCTEQRRWHPGGHTSLRKELAQFSGLYLVFRAKSPKMCR